MVLKPLEDASVCQTLNFGMMSVEHVVRTRILDCLSYPFCPTVEVVWYTLVEDSALAQAVSHPDEKLSIAGGGCSKELIETDSVLLV